MNDKIIKNPARQKKRDNSHLYETAHSRLNIEPQKLNFGATRNMSASTSQQHKGFMPPKIQTISPAQNIQVISAVDNDLFDEDGNEFVVDTNKVIDNNDFVEFPEDDYSQNQDEPDEFNSPQVGNYILMVFGRKILVGSQEAIEARVKDIVYGEDEEFIDKGIGVDDIVVLKRLPLKIGVFVGE